MILLFFTKIIAAEATSVLLNSLHPLDVLDVDPAKESALLVELHRRVKVELILHTGHILHLRPILFQDPEHFKAFAPLLLLAEDSLLIDHLPVHSVQFVHFEEFLAHLFCVFPSNLSESLVKLHVSLLFLPELRLHDSVRTEAGQRHHLHVHWESKLVLLQLVE